MNDWRRHESIAQYTLTFRETEDGYREVTIGIDGTDAWGAADYTGTLPWSHLISQAAEGALWDFVEQYGLVLP